MTTVVWFKRDLRTWLRLKFFAVVHKRMYENRPIHWPLCSAKKTFVAWVNIHRMNALAAPVAPIANATNRSYPVRFVLEKIAGFDRSRPMPKVVRQTFQKWFDKRKSPDRLSSTRGKIVLFHDTFMNFNHLRLIVIYKKHQPFSLNAGAIICADPFNPKIF